MTIARVVLPVPGGPHRMMEENSRSASMARYHFITGDRRSAQGYLDRLQKADRDHTYSERIKNLVEEI